MGLCVELCVVMGVSLYECGVCVCVWCLWEGSDCMDCVWGLSVCGDLTVSGESDCV